jgi:tryptophan synthase alpha chain
MPTKRYRRCFESLSRRREGAFMPFTVLGDPDPETSLAILESFARGGADMLELGIPFSDPIADGPAIQVADNRALAAGVSPADALAVLAEFRRRHADIPVGLLVYANLVHRPGLTAFYDQGAAAGADSVLVADLPWEEAAPFRAAARAAGVGAVSMITPTTSDWRMDRLLAQNGPFLYVVSRLGVTGKDTALAEGAEHLLSRIRRRTQTPAMLGFGISRPKQVRQAIAAGAAGAISGSAVVEIVSKHHGSKRKTMSRRTRSELCAEIESFVATMKAATRQ